MTTSNNRNTKKNSRTRDWKCNRITIYVNWPRHMAIIIITIRITSMTTKAKAKPFLSRLKTDCTKARLKAKKRREKKR